MLAAISFDYQSTFKAHEVDDEWPDWTLTPDFEFLQAAIT
jgi:hypothetical protein